jgi:hypothetical protein
MQFSLPISQSLPIEAALLQAGQSAMTTVILSQKKVFDLSRLSLLRFTIENPSPNWPSEVSVQAEMVEGKTSEAGKHYVIQVDLGQGSVEFEIMDRKRGLRSQLLRNLHTPQKRALEGAPTKELTLQGVEGEVWPVASLMLAALPSPAPKQFSFHIYGAAVAARPIAVRANGDLVELVQENALIAQLI